MDKYGANNTYIDLIESNNSLGKVINAVSSLVRGGSFSVQGLLNGETDFQNDTLVSRGASILAGTETPLGISATKSLGLSLANSVLSKGQIAFEKWAKEPLGFMDAVDSLDVDKLKLDSSVSKIISGVFPIYLFSEVKKAGDVHFNIHKDTTFSWTNYSNGDYIVDTSTGKNVISSPEDITNKQSILYKTQQLFKSGKINTLITDLDNSDPKYDNSNGIVSRGRALKEKDGVNYARVWTVNNQYRNIRNLMRPFNPTGTSENLTILEKDLARVRPGAEALKTHGVLEDSGFVKITPYKRDGKYGKDDIKKYMFSLENLAWKGSLDSLIEGTSQEGPNGGRLMWFPPYDIKFNEDSSVNWNSDTYIGRGEPVYSYINTERSGTLSFKMIVDHPSIINYYKQANPDGSTIKTEDYLRFFSGNDVVDLEYKEPEVKDNPPYVPKVTPEGKPIIYKFKVYFPNNLSGKDYMEDPAKLIKYLYSGAYCDPEYPSGKGYEMAPKTGLTMNENISCRTSYSDNAISMLNDILTEINNYLSIVHSEYSITPYTNYSESGVSGGTVSFNSIFDCDLTYNGETLSQASKNAIGNIEIVTDDFNLKFPEYNLTVFDGFYYSPVLVSAFPEQQQKGWEVINNGSMREIEALKTKITADKVLRIDDSFYIFDEDKKDEMLRIRKKKIVGENYGYGEYNVKDLLSFELNSKRYNNNNTDSNSTGNVICSFKEMYELINKGTDISFDNNLVLNKNDIKEIQKIEIVGYASSQGNDVAGGVEKNDALANNRGELIGKWLGDYFTNAKIEPIKSFVSKENYGKYADDTNAEIVKKDRCVLVQMTFNSTTEIVNEDDKKAMEAKQAKDEAINKTKRQHKNMHGYYWGDNKTYSPKNQNETLFNDEAQFFEPLNPTDDFVEELMGEYSRKIKHFHPAFHSTTPEGFNSRLTFLNQCTRQGPTNKEKSSTTAGNMSFGRPPVCVLRIGDFYNTKIIVSSLAINYEPLIFDLNTEGIGVQPMMADVNIQFKFVGGSDLTGPIARLQNAITFNFFANTGVYDDRNDRLKSYTYNERTKKYDDNYDLMYNPRIYD